MLDDLHVVTRMKEFLRGTQRMLLRVASRCRQHPHFISQEATDLILRALRFERRKHRIHYLRRALLTADLINPEAEHILDDSSSVDSNDTFEDSDENTVLDPHDVHAPGEASQQG
jgi:hypothetical protein